MRGDGLNRHLRGPGVDLEVSSMERELETETTAAATEPPITTVAVAPEPEVCDYSLVGQPCEEGSTCVIDTTECCGELYDTGVVGGDPYGRPIQFTPQYPFSSTTGFTLCFYRLKMLLSLSSTRIPGVPL